MQFPLFYASLEAVLGKSELYVVQQNLKFDQRIAPVYKVLSDQKHFDAISLNYFMALEKMKSLEDSDAL